jgi:nucleoside-diphosphate-sugar epimerase
VKGVRVLLVGGNGFMGRHAAAELADRADRITVLDRPGTAATVRPGAPDLPSGADCCQGSVADPGDVREAVTAAKPDVIVVFAAFGLGDLGLVPSAERDPRRAVDVNIGGLLNVLDAAAERPGTRVVWISSTTVYGPAEHHTGGLVDEDDAVAPRSVYAATKVLGEQLIRCYRATFEVEAVAMRPTLVWGPGIRYRGVQAGLSDMVEAAARGTTATVADSAEPWDLLYVRDAGRAVAWLAHATGVGEVILVNGYRASIRDVRHALLTARPEATIHLAGRAPLLGFPHVDDRRARAAGFAPAFDLSSSVADYLAAAQTQPDGHGRTS